MKKLASQSTPRIAADPREGSAPGSKRTRVSLQAGTAIAMLAAGTALSAAGFIVPPLGEISDSVLWLFAQCLLYAGSIFGVSSYVNGKIKEMDGIRSAHKADRPDTAPPETKPP